MVAPYRLERLYPYHFENDLKMTEYLFLNFAKKYVQAFFNNFFNVNENT